VSGVFHLVTHAFFKALLFLGSGSVIFAMHRAFHATNSAEDAQDMRNMGGLRRYMPWTFWLMLAATLAISGIFPFAGFFSKDAILGTVFLRARESTLADAHWLGIPGNVILYACYVIGLAAAFMTAVYMMRMLIYTFLGPNRSGERERDFLGEAPWIMTGPLLVLGVLSVVGGWLNLPESIPLGRVGVLDRWLEPVVGESALRITHGAATEATPTLEYSLIGAAVIIAIAGIVVAWAMLKPARLVPKREARPEEGFERVLANKYYVDEVYDDAVVQPTIGLSRDLLWQGIDNGLIDKVMVTFFGARVPRFVGWIGSQLQSGQVGTYAWVLVVGVLFVLGAFTIR
jgi:NADH-quinone oxidoreductase subunit L